MAEPESPKLGDLFKPVDRSWWDALSDEEKRAYLAGQPPLRAEVLSDTVTTGIEAVMGMGSSTVEGWYLDQEPEDYPDRERTTRPDEGA